MAKRRKNRGKRAGTGKGAGSKGATRSPSKGRSTPDPSRAGKPAAAAATDANADLPLAETLKTHPVPVYLVTVGLVAFAGLYLAVLLLGLNPTLFVANADLAAHPVVLAGFGAWCLVAAYGLVTRTPWGWWAAAALVQYQVYQNAWRAVLSDVSAESTAGSSDLIMLTSGLRLLLWVAAGLYLHGFGTAQHYGLSWIREEERRRTHRVITYGFGLLIALHLGARFIGPAAPVS